MSFTATELQRVLRTQSVVPDFNDLKILYLLFLRFFFLLLILLAYV